jgi:hypothetical protein
MNLFKQNSLLLVFVLLFFPITARASEKNCKDNFDCFINAIENKMPSTRASRTLLTDVYESGLLIYANIVQVNRINKQTGEFEYSSEVISVEAIQNSEFQKKIKEKISSMSKQEAEKYISESKENQKGWAMRLWNDARRDFLICGYKDPQKLISFLKKTYPSGGATAQTVMDFQKECNCTRLENKLQDSYMQDKATKKTIMINKESEDIYDDNKKSYIIKLKNQP